MPLYRRPVVLLKKALYGHPDAGTYWEQHCNRAVNASGFEPVVTWPSCFYHPKLELFLVVYVDDFKMAGPKRNLKTGWDSIRARINLDDPAPAHLYLGCIHERRQVQTENGIARAVIYNMEDYLTSTVTRYCSLARDLTGKAPVLRKVATPFINEDHKESPACRPAATGPLHTCPWCQHSFPQASTNQLTGSGAASTDVGAGSGGPKKKQVKAPDEAPAGKLQTAAASILMGILYVARMARFDLLRATCGLACFITKWTVTCDKRLLQLICYIDSSKHLRQVGWVGDLRGALGLHLYADADFAGDSGTQRSTSGVHLCIKGSNTNFPLSGISKRQSCISSSTPEAEFVCGHFAHKNVLIPAMDLWEVLIPSGCNAVYHEDNQAMIQVIKTGRNPTMRHLHRVHRIGVGWLHERLGNVDTRDNVLLEYTASKDMCADVYTKHFVDKEKWGHALSLINVLDPRTLKDAGASALARQPQAVKAGGPALCCVQVPRRAAAIRRTRGIASTALGAGHPDPRAMAMSISPWDVPPPLTSLPAEASASADPGVLSSIRIATKVYKRPQSWGLSLPSLAYIDRNLHRAVGSLIDHKYMMVMNLAYGSILPQIATIDIVTKTEIIQREGEKLGIGILEQQLGELLAIWSLCPDTENALVPITPELVEQAAVSRGCTEYTREHFQVMAEWLNGTEAQWLHGAIYDLLARFNELQSSGAASTAVGAGAGSEWMMDSSGLIFNPKGKALSMFTVIARDLGTTYPSLHTDVVGGCRVDWWKWQNEVQAGYIQLLENYIKPRREGPLAPAFCVGSKYAPTFALRYPIGVRGWARTMLEATRISGRPIYQEETRAMLQGKDADTLDAILAGSTDGLTASANPQAPVTVASTALGADGREPPAHDEMTTSEVIGRHENLDPPLGFNAVTMAQAATSTDIGAGGLTIHEGIVSFRFDPHSMLIIWDALNSLYDGGSADSPLIRNRSSSA